MGFMNKLKDVAKSAKEQVEKTIAEQISTQVNGKELTESQSELPSYGSVTNSEIQTDKNSYISLYLDADTEKVLIVYTKFNPVVSKSKKSIIEEYSFSDIIEFKCTNVKVNSDNDRARTTINCYYSFLLSSGKEIAIHSYYEFVSPEEFKETSISSLRKGTIEAYFQPLSLYYLFHKVIKDITTKFYLNQIYEANGFLPVYNKNGEFIYDNIDKNSAKFEKDYPIKQ